MPDASIYMLQLEAIGEDQAVMIRNFEGAVSKLMPCASGHRSPSLFPWVAEIQGIDPTYGFQREFLKCMKDYSGANSKGSRGVIYTFVLYPGVLYEVSCKTSWFGSRRYFCTLVDGSPKEMTREQAEDFFGGAL